MAARSIEHYPGNTFRILKMEYTAGDLLVPHSAKTWKACCCAAHAPDMIFEKMKEKNFTEEISSR